VKPIRTRSGLSAEQVAERVMCSSQTIYRMEAGQGLPARRRMVAILAVIDATDEEREAALGLWEVADVDGSQLALPPDLPATYRRFRMDEAEAELERTLDMVVVPGLLQTEDYATALSAGARRLIRSQQWADRAGEDRHERRALLTRDQPLRYHGLISEAALRNLVGTRDVMRAQLAHLVAMSELPHVTIQVRPHDLGGYGGMSGPIQLLRFSDHEDAAYVESAVGMEVVQEQPSVMALSAMWEDVASAVPSPERSIDMVKAAMERWA
jgi:transcriptional regulator with XRE-family HTH domain